MPKGPEELSFGFFALLLFPFLPRQGLALYWRADAAASETIRICLERGVLVAFLNARQKEAHVYSCPTGFSNTTQGFFVESASTRSNGLRLSFFYATIYFKSNIWQKMPPGTERCNTMAEFLNLMRQTFLTIENRLPSATVLSSLAILTSLVASSISLYQSVAAKRGKIIVSLHIIYSTENFPGKIDPETSPAAEISVINCFSKAKYIKDVFLRFPFNAQKDNNDFYITCEQFKIRSGELLKIPVCIRQEHLDYFNIRGLHYYAGHQVRAILIDTHNRKWISKDGLTPGNIFTIVNASK